MSYRPYYQARDTIFKFIIQDTFGPVDEDEILQDPPLDTYVCGILWPKGTQSTSKNETINTPENISDQSPDTNFGSEIDEDQTDVIRAANQFRPSVMGISFAASKACENIELSFSSARYENIDVPVENKTYILHEYKRIPMTTGRISIKLPKHSKRIPLFDQRCFLQITKRKILSENAVLWTISIENAKLSGKNEIQQNTASLFQCKLIVYGNFQPINNASRSSRNQDRQKQDFLYRKIHSYAVGHGCSVSWDEDTQPVTAISSTFLPHSIISQMIAVQDDGFLCFNMSFWLNTQKAECLSNIKLYVEKYQNWKDQLETEIPFISQTYQEIAKILLANISDCIERLKEGIKVLQNNDDAWRAFCLMNKAMMRQSAKKRKQSEDNVTWYPFQLCYVLMCVPDIVDCHSKWRNTVDLLWFPTGGGKTEAYLGVAAFTIFYRRLTKGENSFGTTVLMRYTLRMLTAQQFERAAALICECDLIRQQEQLPGGEISIGLWVGGAVTPNHVTSNLSHVETAETILKKLKENHAQEVGSTPIQLSKCPYCGTTLLPDNAYAVQNNHFHAHCPNKNCPFHDELPVVTVDDDIYERRPTMLIGTIDKFARLAWDEKTGAIFAEDGHGLPPELLIQDELHLISGPLGSVSGLYELAIEKLCEHKGIKPKILASTATLCNAEEQIRALYRKSTFQFPPSGFDANDSFFARTATAEERPQRLYIGLCETGGSLTDAIIRIFGVVRFALQYLIKTGTDPHIIDQFWTHIGYFNSLKDLGTADTLIIDRVCAYAESLRRHKFKVLASNVGIEKISYQYEYGELTSRKSTREITEIRNQLDNQHYPNDAALSYVLSSNMLSVGIDINRLGIMTVYGQPKTTAEYIQATSRVGRSNPGLVIVLLHMLRTRDKSHYEQFQTYHQALNKMVEPTSATPYACRTLDRALHAVFVILVRHLCPELRTNADAANFRSDNPQIMHIRAELINRIRDYSAETADYAEEILDDFIYLWHEAATNRSMHFQYQLLNQSENDTDVLLVPADRMKDSIFPPTMNSMRNVDTASGVYLKR